MNATAFWCDLKFNFDSIRLVGRTECNEKKKPWTVHVNEFRILLLPRSERFLPESQKVRRANSIDVSVYLRPDISQNRNTNWHCVSGVHSHSFDKQHFVMGPVVTRLIELKIGPLTFDCWICKFVATPIKTTALPRSVQIETINQFEYINLLALKS